MENEKDPTEQYENWKAPENTNTEVLSEREETTKLEEKEVITENEKFLFDELGASLRPLLARLREREDLRFNQLITQENSARLAGAAVSIKESISKPNTDLVECQDALSKLASALETFGDVPRERMLKDDSDNLRRINFLINQVRDKALGLRGALGAQEQENLQPLIVDLRRIDSSLEKIWQWIAKKASALERLY